MGCPNGTIINNVTRSCDPCPADCPSCYRNKSTGKTECIGCTNFKTLDPVTKLCLSKCFSGQKFYYETMTCRSCPLYQSYSNDLKACSDCSYGCINCYQQFNNNTPSCIDCDSNFIYDYNTGQCKLPCNETTIYNYQSKSCESCPPGKYFDLTWKKCMSCIQPNCDACVKNQTT
jgi:hypothetical protein